ncbi:uncharacterized protein GLRG_07906 [Colletotrichum graminicola M1.001]|uniref:Ankyrin repeat protein n=1 Tax=Colletotrichum graminicola (strain M1.001 / M2 / FGSC 10212) TaxID=645133 RepID=E3QPH4_COLGM|nr:uncharacterized protein GLRG_07906 [Colletotrichum graminicola M1.001]EFQ32762.1 hypothetical protein GLRG_07906 [Colletotrichum graminicola M1.001]
MSLFSSLQQYAGTFAAIAAGTIIAKVVGNMQSDLQDPEPDQVPQEPGNYKPTPIDVVVVRIMLEKASKLPPEIMDIIIDEAEYWAHSEASISTDLRVVGTTSEENKLLLRCPPIGFRDFKKVGAAFKTAPLPPKSGDGSPVTEPLRSLTLLEPMSSPTEMTSEAPREYFTGSMERPPMLTNPVRKIVFKIRSRDQGWGGAVADKGTYRGSWSWFEAGLEKFDKDRKCDGSCKASAQESQSENTSDGEEPALCTCGLQSIYPPVEQLPHGQLAYHHHMHPLENLKIQNNKTAHRPFLDHEVVWSWSDDIHPDSPEADQLVEMGRGRGTGTGKFVRSLKLGDVITVWGKARFGGWANHIQSVKVEIYWAV